MNLFTQHPKSVGQTYIGHMKYAIWIALQLGVMSIILFTHALLPFLFETYTSKTIKEIYLDMEKRQIGE